jgi:hypothetical protein
MRGVSSGSSGWSQLPIQRAAPKRSAGTWSGSDPLRIRIGSLTCKTVESVTPLIGLEHTAMPWAKVS